MHLEQRQQRADRQEHHADVVSRNESIKNNSKPISALTTVCFPQAQRGKHMGNGFIGTLEGRSYISRCDKRCCLENEMLNWTLALIALTAAIYTALFWGLRSFFDAAASPAVHRVVSQTGVALTHQPRRNSSFLKKLFDCAMGESFPSSRGLVTVVYHAG
jgi:hypothetical protein